MTAESYSFRIGAFDCLAIADGGFHYPSHAFAINVSQDDLQRELMDQGRSGDHLFTPYTCLAIDTGRNKVLVDTGAGNLAPSTGHLIDNLRQHGIHPEDFDTVIITHGHADHIGANTDGQGNPIFPNARYVMWRSEWEFWVPEPDLSMMRADEHLKELLRTFARTHLQPLRDEVDLIDAEVEIVPGIQAIAAPGHTPGHMALAIQSNGELLLDLVDTVLDPILLAHPDWINAVDLLPDVAAQTRQRLLDRAVSEGALVLLYHFPLPSLGYIMKKGLGWRWDPLDVTTMLPTATSTKE